MNGTPMTHSDQQILKNSTFLHLFKLVM